MNVALFCALLVGFLPVVTDLAGTLSEHSWARVSLVFPFLLWIVASREAQPGPPARWGLFLILLGLGIEIFAIAGHVVRFGRVGLICAAIGLCAWRGLCGRRTSVLFLWAIPIPATILNAISPLPESLYGAVLRSVFSDKTVPLQQLGTSLYFEGRALALIPADGGIPLAIALVGFVIFGGLMRGESNMRLIVLGVYCALAGFLIQGVVLGVGVASFMRGINAESIRLAWATASWTLVPLMGALGVVAMLGFAGSKRISRSNLNPAYDEPVGEPPAQDSGLGADA